MRVGGEAGKLATGEAVPSAGEAERNPSLSPQPPLGEEPLGEGEPEVREWLLRGAALGRRVAALLDIETPVAGVDAGELEPALRAVARFERADGATPRERTDDLALRTRWGYRGQGGVVMPGAGWVVRQGDGTLDVVANDDARWTGVPEAVWGYALGGYGVLKKWLSYREAAVLGRPLTLEEVRTFTSICRRITLLLALGPELDTHYRAAAQEGDAEGV